MTKRTIFLIGIIVLAVIYQSLKGSINDIIFFGCGIAYLVSLRVLAEKFGK